MRRELKMLGILLKILDHLLARRVARRSSGKRKVRQGRMVSVSVKMQAVIVTPPARTDRGRSIHDDKGHSPLLQTRSNREACGTSTYHERIYLVVHVRSHETDFRNAVGSPYPRCEDRDPMVDGIQPASPLVTSIGVPTVLESSWPLLKATLDGVVVSSLEVVAHAVYQQAKHNHFVVEGAGVAALAAAHHPFFAGQRVVAVLSGGTIDTETPVSVLMNGGLPPESASHC
jgi:hypothetical protein